MGQYANPLSFFVEPMIKDNPVDLRKQSVIPAHSNVFTRVYARAELANQNISRPHSLTAKYFHTPALPLAVASIARTSPRLFMRHG
jgi:hypothetical protein